MLWLMCSYYDKVADALDGAFVTGTEDLSYDRVEQNGYPSGRTLSQILV